ncbi:MAG: hypothetical protein Q9M36_05670 [Sulfurovum sp.]|nr:hypothetical protein [Sulfurovum sp.]
MEFFIKAQQFVHEMQILVAVLFGMFVQFFFGNTKNTRVALTVVISSLFVALYIVPPLIDMLKIKSDGVLAISGYALSSVMSIEILSLIIDDPTSSMREKAENYLGVDTQRKEDEDEN